MERSLRKEASHERRVPETPKDKCRRCNKISWSTVSNAALTSKRAKSVSWQRSTAPRRSESRRRRRVLLCVYKYDVYGLAMFFFYNHRYYKAYNIYGYNTLLVFHLESSNENLK